jgi:hypothetical protein
MTNVERRHNAPDTRTLPRTERRQGLPDMRDSEKPTKSVYRVNYYVAGQIQSAFVTAFTPQEAVAFLGIKDDSATVSNVAHPVEVVGVDKVHDPLPVAPIFKAPPAPAKQLSDAELASVRALLGTKPTSAGLNVSPIVSYGPTSTGPERRHGAQDMRPVPQVNRRKV